MRYREAYAYRVYVTEALRLMPQGQAIRESLADILRPHEAIDADAIIDHVTSIIESE